MKYIHKNTLLKLASISLLVITALIIHSCRKDSSQQRLSSPAQTALKAHNMDLSMLQTAYNKGVAKNPKLKVQDVSQQTLADMVGSLNVDWSSYTLQEYADSSKIIEFEMPDDTSLYILGSIKAGDTIKYHNKTKVVFLLKNDTLKMSFFMKMIEDLTTAGSQSVISQLHYLQIPSTFTGQIMYFTLDRQFINGWGWQNGTIGTVLSPTSTTAPTTQGIQSIKQKVNLLTYSCQTIPVTYIGVDATYASIYLVDVSYTPGTIQSCGYSGSLDVSGSGSTGGAPAGGVSGGGAGAASGGSTGTAPKCPTTSVSAVNGKVLQSVAGCPVATTPVAPPPVPVFLTPGSIDEDDDNNSTIGYDNTVYPAYQQSMSWPAVANIITKANFVGWVNNANCLNRAKQQISQLGYCISNYSAPGQTIQVYTESTGINTTNSKLAVGYLNSVLQKGIPVIVGVDTRTSGNGYIVKKGNLTTDASTDHFIVIIGMGTDSKGNFYQFYDSSTSILADGTSNNNKLYYNTTTGMITGNTDSQYDNSTTQNADNTHTIHPYVLTQVRKSKKCQ